MELNNNVIVGSGSTFECLECFGCRKINNVLVGQLWRRLAVKYIATCGTVHLHPNVRKESYTAKNHEFLKTGLNNVVLPIVIACTAHFVMPVFNNLQQLVILIRVYI